MSTQSVLPGQKKKLPPQISRFLGTLLHSLNTRNPQAQGSPHRTALWGAFCILFHRILWGHLGPIRKGRARFLRGHSWRAARWARGAYGVVPITAHMCDLGWLSLADRQRNQRPSLSYTIGYFRVPWASHPTTLTSYGITGRTIPGSHLWKLSRVPVRDRHTPMWRVTVIRTIPQWITLSSWTVHANSLLTFKSQLSGAGLLW